MDSNVVDDVLGDLSIGFTNTVEKCRGHLTQVVGREMKPLDMARILIVMLKSRPIEYWQDTDASKEKSQDVSPPWSIDNLVQATRELVCFIS